MFGTTDSDFKVAKGSTSSLVLGKPPEELMKAEARSGAKPGRSTYQAVLTGFRKVVDMLNYERKLVRHHNNGKEPWYFHTSLEHQAARQDLLATACLDNSQVVALLWRGGGGPVVVVGAVLTNPFNSVDASCAVNKNSNRVHFV